MLSQETRENFIIKLKKSISLIKAKIALSVFNHLFFASALAFYLIAPQLKPKLVKKISITMIAAITLFAIISAFLYLKLPIEENEKIRNLGQALLIACTFGLVFSCFSSSISLAALFTVFIIAALCIYKKNYYVYPNTVEHYKAWKKTLISIHIILCFTEIICLIKPNLDRFKITTITTIALLITTALTIDVVLSLNFKSNLKTTLKKQEQEQKQQNTQFKGKGYRISDGLLMDYRVTP